MVDRRTQPRLVIVVVLVALAAAALAWWSIDRRDRGRAGRPDNPVVLVISPAHGDAALATALGAALSRQSGLAIRVESAASRADAVAAAGLARVDGGVLPLFDYLLAHQEYGVQAALQLVRQQGARATTGVLMVRADGPITAVEQLAGQPVAFADRASTTGFLLPARYLKEHGVAVRAVFTGTHEASLALVTQGGATAAGTYAHERPGFRTVATTGEVPNEPLFFHPRLPRAIRTAIADAFVALAATADGRALLGRMTEVTGVVPVAHADYAQVNDLLSVTQQRLADLVPDGRRLMEANRQPAPPPMGD